MDPAPLDNFFRHAPSSVDVEAIRRSWLALGAPYDVNQWLLPLPLWVHRDYDHSSSHAWEVLRDDLSRADANKPFCIYLHVPFCSRKCGFCDSYSFKLGSHTAEHIQQYVERLCYELRLWGEQGNLHERPVSTVHLGGETPTFLGETALTQVVECCKACFAVSPLTEWALESTVEALTPSVIETMHHLGFRRLHLGVQSLQDTVRQAIGRRRPAAEVFEKIETTLALGWVVSVDLVCGLPFQTLEGFMADIEALIAAGINGFSLYELLIYPQNYKWAEKYHLTQRSHVPNFFMFLAGADLLTARGYRKNLFNHWADARDANIYFTFPMRREDLLAVGTIADGVFADYHYRHPLYASYLKTACGGSPGLEGGLRRTEFESRMQPLVTAILSGNVASELVPHFHVPGIFGDEILVEQWLDNALASFDQSGGLHLTNSGSWFAGNLISELTSQHKKLAGR